MIWVSINMPAMASASPGIMIGIGPIRGSRLATKPAVTMTPG